MKRMKKCAVICKYAENLDWVKDLSIPYVIYNKGIDVEENHIQVPNKGRESEVFLRYIIENYDSLPQYVVFLQGGPHFHCHNVISMINEHYDSKLVSLSNSSVIDDEYGYPNHVGLPIKEIVELLGLPSSKYYEFGPGAQYIVSRDLIINKNLGWWKRAYEIHDSYNLAPWVYERIWPLIFKHVEK